MVKYCEKNGKTYTRGIFTQAHSGAPKGFNCHKETTHKQCKAVRLIKVMCTASKCSLGYCGATRPNAKEMLHVYFVKEGDETNGTGC